MFENNSIKQQILRKATQYKNQKLFQDFLDGFYSYIPIDIKNDHKINEFVDIAISTFEIIKNRKPSTSKVDISQVKAIDSNSESYNIVHLVNDDMPFIVDSITELLNKRKYRVIHMINSLLYVERDKAGNVKAIINDEEHKPNESIIYIKIVPVKNPEALQRLSIELTNVLKHVRCAVSDWKPMVQKMCESEPWLQENREDKYQYKENTNFLEWLVNDNFIFIGYKEFKFEPKSSASHIHVTTEDSLGVMKIVDKEFNDNIIEDIFLSDKRIWSSIPITIGKIREVSKVHRYSAFDYICVMKHEKGKVARARVFIGLFVSKLDYQSVTSIPIIREMVNSIADRVGFDKSSFNGKELSSIIETFPRDELFQLSEDELFLTSMMILSCINNPRLILFIRENRCKVFLNILIFFPKVRVTSDIIEKITNIIQRHIPGKFINNQLKISTMNLAYVQISMKVKNNRDLEIDVLELEQELDKTTTLWIERFNHYIEEKLQYDKASEIVAEYKNVFPSSYQSTFTVTDAIEDVYYIEQLSKENKVIFRLYHYEGGIRGCLNLKAYSFFEKIDLYKIMPILENLGFNALEERVFILDKKIDGSNLFIQDFVLDVCVRRSDFELIRNNIEEAISRIYHGHLRNDIINKLILNAGLNWRQVYLLKGYCKFLLQIKFPYSQEFIKQTLVKHPVLTRSIVEYFYSKFEKVNNDQFIKNVRKKVEEELSNVLDNIEDRIFKHFVNLIDNTVRTNFFQAGDEDQYKKYISFKLDSNKIFDIPLPAPFKEIFVYSTTMEGVHLRGGKVSRGGLRWSDHVEDYRGEVLGLMKAQMTKNSVIVPEGSKGGFVVKNISELHSRDEIFAEGIKSYKIFLRGLLDITDNIKDGKIVKPVNVVCYDEDDPYLVVAADKGTATFSDIANTISKEYDFWLGDAFASGGSAGYDHKKLAITARGAWVSVEEHFKLLGIDPNQNDFTVSGIGDMSGDVFGNGMLLSKHIKLVAAFNHIHIFIDPSPDAAKSFEERKRLFELPRSQWSDYNAKLISKGGGIFSRKAKQIDVTPEMKTLLDIDSVVIEPEKLIRKILCAKVDLLWNGGIGTYVKAESQSNQSVGDKPNDDLRVNGKELRCRVVAEGGNLGFTQLGRVEYAFNGGLINTDFIDNSAGVDCSDHEVNIKIALGQAVRAGNLDVAKRNKLLEKMQNAVCDLVLEDNLYQNIAVSIASSVSVKLFEVMARLIAQLKENIGLNPELEYLPTSTEMGRRIQEKLGFTRPELAVLMAYSKNAVYKNLINSKLPDDPYFEKYLINYFPTLMQQSYINEIKEHQLRREIIATCVSNHIVNHIGAYFFHDAQSYSGLNGCDIARAYHVVWDIFGIEELWNKISELDSNDIRIELFYNVGSFMQTAIYWMLRNSHQPLNVQQIVDEYKKDIKYLHEHMQDSISGAIKERYDKKLKQYQEQGLKNSLASKMAMLNELYLSMDIVFVSNKIGVEVKKVAEIYFEIGHRFHYDWLANKADELQGNSYWKRMLTKTIKDDILDQQRTLTLNIINSYPKITFRDKINHWCSLNKAKISIYNKFIDSVKSMEDIDSAKLVVSIKQGEALIK